MARASRKFPALLTMLADGRLHLSGIAELIPHLNAENCDELLARATHKSKREIQKVIAEIDPKPDIPEVMRKLPARKPKPKTTPPAKDELGPDVPPEEKTAQPTEPTEESTDTRNAKPKEKPSVVVPLGPRRSKVQFTASEELHDKLERLAALMPGADLATIVEAAVTEKLERLEAKRYGKTKSPRKNLEDAETSPGSRTIPAPVRRFIWTRDGGRCTFVSRDGKRCGDEHQ